MMKCLVIKHRPNVLDEIAHIVNQTVPDTIVDLAEDGATARKYLSSEIYDLLIIDLTLPHMKGGTPDYRVADELLKELFNLQSLNIPGDIIGLTRDREALGLVHTSFGPHVMVAIQEDEVGDWRRYLSDKIKYASRAAVTRQISVNQHYLYDSLIITALDKEFEPYSDKFDFHDIRHFA